MHAKFKPHHFLDFIYEMAENGSVFDTYSPYGHIMGYYGNLLSAGKIDTVSFTTGADDACAPCKNLADGICQDTLASADTARHGFTRKYDYNMKLDLDFIAALPEIFTPDREISIDRVYATLKEKLTPEIILLNWEREKRVELTLKGLDMAIEARKEGSHV